MEAYLAMRIEEKALNYNTVITKKPQYKEGIDTILTADGYVIDKDGWAEKQVAPAQSV
jgi:hypothetical protein